MASNSLESLRVGSGQQTPSEIEQAILGVVMLETGAISKIDGLLPEMFLSSQGHKHILTACRDLHSEGLPIDLLTVKSRLLQRGLLDAVGGAHYLSELTSRVTGSTNMEYWSLLLKQRWLRSQILSLSDKAKGMAADPDRDVFDVIDSTLGDIHQMLTIVQKGKGSRSVGEIGAVANERITAVQEGRLTNGLPQTITDLARIMPYWVPSELTILAARPSMGKTAVVLNIANGLARLGYGVGVFSLEMSAESLVQRLVSNIEGIDGMLLREGKMGMDEFGRVQQGFGKLKKLPIWINDSANMDMASIRTQTQIMIDRYKCQIILVDYLQLVHTTGKKNSNREQDVSAMSRAFKMLTKEFNVPIILLSQLSRAVESRADKRPMLSDLRESGAIEQDADNVLFLYRPEYYGITEIEDLGGVSSEGVMEIITAKQRNGIVGNVHTGFEKQYQRVLPLSEVGWSTPFETTPPTAYNPHRQFQQERDLSEEIGAFDIPKQDAPF